MSESKQQSNLIKMLEKQGWYVLKLIKTNKNGIPDLLALKRGNTPWFIEVKAIKGRLSKLQTYRIEELKKEGFKAEVYYEKLNSTRR